MAMNFDKIEERAETWQAKYKESLQYQKYVIERPARGLRRHHPYAA